MMIFRSWFWFLIFSIVLTATIAVGGISQIPLPARIGGSVTVDSTQLTQATATDYTFVVTKQAGTAYVPAAQSTGLNASNWYVINIPIYNAISQPGGANPGDTAVIHVYRSGTELSVSSPAGGQLTVGDEGSTTPIPIVATTAPATYTVTFTAGSGGTLTGTTTQTVNAGSNCTAVTAVPNNGYRFTGWTGDYTGTNNPLTITNVTANMNIQANFAANTHTVTFTAGSGGTLTGTTTQTVAHGGNCTAVTAVPNNGYRFTGWTGYYTGTDNPLTVTNVTTDMNIIANFSAQDPDECPDCSGGAVTLTNVTFPTDKTCECVGTISIAIGSGVSIPTGATVTFRAPIVHVSPGFCAENGATVSIKQQ